MLAGMWFLPSGIAHEILKKVGSLAVRPEKRLAKGEFSHGKEGLNFVRLLAQG